MNQSFSSALAWGGVVLAGVLWGGGALVASAGAPTELAPEVATPPAAPEKPPEESGIGALLDTILGGGSSDNGTSDSGSSSGKSKPQKEKKPFYQQKEDQGRD